jgi:four helix bundle protein
LVSRKIRGHEGRFLVIGFWLLVISFGGFGSMQDYRKLNVWQKAHELTLAVYHATAGFPADEKFGLTSQLRRAASSIPANIAEGCGRDGNAELARFLHIAMGSASELDYHILLARDLKMLEASQYIEIEHELTSLRKMLNTFIHTVKASKN